MTDAMTWFEIPTADFDRAVDFYDAVLGAPLRRGEFMGVRHGFFNADGVSGAVVDRNTTGASGPLLYLNAGQALAELLARVPAAGGAVETPLTAIGPQGWFAVIRDTEGNLVGLHQPAE